MESSMLTHLRPAIVMLALFVALTGLAYPLSITGIAQIAMPHAANGSLIEKNGQVIGSNLIGQNFADAKYFHGRPSATSAPDPNDATKTVDAPYNAGNSSGSNLGPTSKKLVDRVQGDVAALRADGLSGPVPADSVTTSASGLDPHISPENALAQSARVAKARSLPEQQVKNLVTAHIDGRTWGIFGEPRVNVLSLNLALEAIKP
jgi:K+-transporting ATPase ATPase C chain